MVTFSWGVRLRWDHHGQACRPPRHRQVPVIIVTAKIERRWRRQSLRGPTRLLPALFRSILVEKRSTTWATGSRCSSYAISWSKLPTTPPTAYQIDHLVALMGTRLRGRGRSIRHGSGLASNSVRRPRLHSSGAPPSRELHDLRPLYPNTEAAQNDPN